MFRPSEPTKIIREDKKEETRLDNYEYASGKKKKALKLGLDCVKPMLRVSKHYVGHLKYRSSYNPRR